MAVMGKIGLKDARTVLVRGASAGDVPDIARLLGELSPESFRARFQGGLPTPSLVATLARADQVPGTVCIVAALPREPQHLVAEARYVPIGGDVAELAVTVLDGYQRPGLGEVMLDALVDRARRGGRSRRSRAFRGGPAQRRRHRGAPPDVAREAPLVSRPRTRSRRSAS